ncbi:hypothetical protein ACIP66_00510 [Pseudomonas sp. NPDC088429]|uniref:hypothetical protein n=1 Tax=Pseudomonas sp. NPDC088429 TaxID=3364455 RepID=UPI00381DD355
MNAIRLALLALSFTLSANAIAAPQTLKQGSLICPTEEAYDKQLKYIVQGVNKLIGGCGFTNKDYKVIVLDLNVFSASHVQVLEIDTEVWTAHESLSN